MVPSTLPWTGEQGTRPKGLHLAVRPRIWQTLARRLRPFPGCHTRAPFAWTASMMRSRRLVIPLRLTVRQRHSCISKTTTAITRARHKPNALA